MSPGKRDAARVDVLGVPVDPLTVDDLHGHLLRFVHDNARATVLHANVHAVNLAERHPWFAKIFRDADLVFCDGHGVMLAARMLRQHLPARITYAEWMWELAAFCRHQALSLYLVGGRPGVADAAASRLSERVPGLRITGTHHGYFDKHAGSPDGSAVISTINGTRPDIVIVGFGMPIQERWVAENRGRIDAPVVLTGGAAFDYISGQLRRPPEWMTNRGLDWLGRLAIEPRRLARRYLLGNPRFMVRVMWARVRR